VRRGELERDASRVLDCQAPVLAVAALLLAAVGSASLAVLAVSAVPLDFAVQGNQMLSLRDIYALRPEARARMNSVYMTCVFLGGAASSAVTGVVSQCWGWPGVAVFAAIVAARKRTADAGLADQVRFEVASAQTFDGGPYDLVTTFDSLHDMGDGGRGDAPRWPSGIDAERPPRVRPG